MCLVCKWRASAINETVNKTCQTISRFYFVIIILFKMYVRFWCWEDNSTPAVRAAGLFTGRGMWDRFETLMVACRRSSWYKAWWRVKTKVLDHGSKKWQLGRPCIYDVWNIKYKTTNLQVNDYYETFVKKTLLTCLSSYEQRSQLGWQTVMQKQSKPCGWSNQTSWLFTDVMLYITKSYG